MNLKTWVTVDKMSYYMVFKCKRLELGWHLHRLTPFLLYAGFQNLPEREREREKKYIPTISHDVFVLQVPSA